MNYSIRDYKSGDFALARSWLTKRDFPAPQSEFLPPEGRVAEVDGVPTALGFFIHTDSPMCFIVNFVSDPEAPRAQRNTSVDFLLDEMVREARAIGYQAVSLLSSAPPMLERFERNNYIKVEENLAHYMGVL